jgi:hypothetical protein
MLSSGQFSGVRILYASVSEHSVLPAHEDGTECAERKHIKFRRREITQKKSYNIQNTAKF